MWHHLWHLIAQSLVFMPSIISGNWISIFFPLCVFLVGEAVRLKQEGWRTMNWGKVGRDAVLMGSAYAVLFVWAVIHSVYRDHADLVARVRALQRDVGIHATITTIIEGVCPGNHSLVLMLLDISNPSGPPTALTNWGFSYRLDSGEDVVAVAPYLPSSERISMPVLGEGKEKVTVLRSQYCPLSNQQLLETGQVRTCWVWAEIPVHVEWDRLVTHKAKMTVYFTEVRTGRLESVETASSDAWIERRMYDIAR